MAERSLRIVIVSWHFPPSQEIGGKVVWRLAKHLALLGCDVRVLVAPESEIRHRDDKYVSALPPGLRVIPTSVGVDPVGAMLRFYKRLRGSPKPSTTNPSSAPATTAVPDSEPQAGQLREFIRALLAFNYHLRWIKPAARHLRQALAEEPADVVLSVSPVFQAHLAVLRARADLKGIPWFVWMHDPSAHYFVAMGGLTILGSNPLGRYVARRRARWEQTAIEKANRLVVTSQGLADAYMKLMPNLRKPLLVPCGFDIDESYRSPQTKSAKLVFVYTGTIYSQQTPRPIIESLARLMKAGLFTPDELEVKFVGRLENEEGRLLLSVARELGLGEVVTSSPQVPHAEALRIISDATVGIAMAEQIVTQIPAKMYEYIALRKPVLALADGTTLDLVNENRIGYACGRDGLDVALTALISQWRHDGLAVFQPALEAAARRYDMANIAKNLLDALREEVSDTARTLSRAQVPA